MAAKVNEIGKQNNDSAFDRPEDKMASKSYEWKTVIDSKTGWFDIDLRELWRYRDLIMLFVHRDFVVTYKQTILGPAWFILQPLFSTIIFTIVFGKVADIPTDGLPQFVFYMAGVTIWNLFASSLTKVSSLFVGNYSILNKVYFPRLVVPIANTITNFITFAIQFSMFLIFVVYFYLQGSNINPNIWIVITPLLLVQQAVLAVGMGLIIAAMTTKYRDLMVMVGFGMQLWMYATPIVYPLSQIPQKWQWLAALNPMSGIVETFRYAFLGAGTVKLWQMGLGVAMTLLIFVLGLSMFSRAEKTFADTI